MCFSSNLQDKKRFAQIVIWNMLCLLFLAASLSLVKAQKIPFQNYTMQNGLP